MLLFISLLACKPKYNMTLGNSDVQELPKATRFTESSLPPELIAETLDKDGNGQPDIWSYKRENQTTPILRALDLNNDGRHDVRSHYNEKGDMFKEEIDGDFDGLVDIVDFYQANVRIECHIDTNTDGVFDIFRFYKNNVLYKQDQDIDLDGKIDISYFYDEKGKLIPTR